MLRTQSMRRGVGIALIAICATNTCGELGESEPSPFTITLTDSGCTTQGVGALLPDRFTTTVVNKTSSRAAINFQRLRDGHAYSELEAHIAQRQQRIAAGIRLEDPPPMTIVWARTDVKPRDSNTIDVGLIPGSYGIVCRRDSTTSDDAEAIFVIGPFRVV